MADLVTSRIFTDGEKGITAAKLNDIIASSVIQPAFVSAKPVTSTADPADNMLILKAAGTYAQVPVSTLTTSIGNALPSQDNEIWLVRLRSTNAAGNPNFEIDQRNVGGASATGFVIDRWNVGKTGTMVVSAGQLVNTSISLPGTNYTITRSPLRITLSTQQTTLASTDLLQITQSVEGPQWRELATDVHSISVLVRSSVSNLKFTVRIGDSPSTKSLVKLCTIPSANTWTLIQLPNIPTWVAGNFSYAPGAIGYTLGITLASGANLVAPAADTWQTGSYIGAPGMSNWAGSTNGSTFDIAFIQHEPGPVCSTLMPKPFIQNLEECLRYYEKSWPYATAVGTANSAGIVQTIAMAASNAIGPVRFKKVMAKVPTITGYSFSSGAINTVRDQTASLDRATSGASAAGDAGFNGFNLSTTNASQALYGFHYVADTGM